MKHISSDKNSDYKDLLNLLEGSQVKKQKRTLIFGEKILNEWLADPKYHCQMLVHWSEEKLAPYLKTNSTMALILTKDLYYELDAFGTGTAIGVFNIPEIQFNSFESPPKGLEVIAACGDPNNLGALIRTATGLGVRQIILTEEACHPFHPKTIRSSAGSVRVAPLQKGPSIRSLNAEIGFALDMHGQNIHQMNWPNDVRIIIGEEGPGVPEALKSNSLSIPLHPEVESLNAATAGALAIMSYMTAHKNG